LVCEESVLTFAGCRARDTPSGDKHALGCIGRGFAMESLAEEFVELSYDGIFDGAASVELCAGSQAFGDRSGECSGGSHESSGNDSDG